MCSVDGDNIMHVYIALRLMGRAMPHSVHLSKEHSRVALKRQC